MRLRVFALLSLIVLAGCFLDDRYSRERAGVFVAEVTADDHAAGPLDLRGPAYFRDDYGRLTVGARLLRPDDAGVIHRGDLFLRFNLPAVGAGARELGYFEAVYREARRVGGVSDEASYAGSGRVRFHEKGGVLHLAFELRFERTWGTAGYHPKNLSMRGVLVSLRNLAGAYVDVDLLGYDLWLDTFDPYDAAYDPDLDYEQWLLDHPEDAGWTSAPGYGYGESYYYGTVDEHGQYVPPPITGDDGWVYEGENGYQGGDDGYYDDSYGGGGYDDSYGGGGYDDSYSGGGYDDSGGGGGSDDSGGGYE